jgi:hypothetical protein
MQFSDLTPPCLSPLLRLPRRHLLLLQWCYSDITVVLQWCYNNTCVTVALPAVVPGEPPTVAVPPRPPNEVNEVATSESRESW